ncbi:MAG TPA: GNAT family N-acetyltransferase [Acidimicrobiales bacterium]|nr:GNAT family N-acetyltransferase [Acidimicrobiales bacterium]
MVSGRYRLGVALLLDPPVADEVDGLRRALGDPALGRIPAHLTLVPPVNVRADQLPAALVRLRAAASVVGGPIQLTLGPPTSFLPLNPVLYLGVGGDTGQLRRLRDAVFASPLERKLSWPWVPHVTLADGIEEARIHSALAALDRFAVVWPVDRLVLLQENAGRLWRPLADAALGPPVIVGTGGLALEITRSRTLDPEVDQMLEEAGRSLGLAGGTGPGERRPPFFPIVMTGRRQGQLEGVAAAWAEPGHGQVAVYVRPESRRQGVGSHLLAHLEVAARRAGWSYEWLEGSGPEQFYLSRGEWVRPTRTPPTSTGPAS